MKLPRWKKERKARKWFQWLRLVIFVVVIFLLFGSGLFIYKTYNQSVLQGAGRKTVVLSSNPILVISFDGNDAATIISLPENLFLETPFGFGSYRLGSIYNLGEQEKIKGGKLLAETVQEFLAVPVEGWIKPSSKFKVQSSKLTKDEMINWKKETTSWKKFLKPQKIVENIKNMDSNLTVFDLVKIWWQLKMTRSDKIKFIDLKETEALSVTKLADKSEVLVSQEDLLDTQLKDLFKDQQITQEAYKIEILNASAKPKIAGKVNRLVNNLGIGVISLANYDQVLKGCEIKTSAKVAGSVTVLRLSKIYDCGIKIENDFDSRVDLTLMIGENYWGKLYEKRLSF